MAETTETSKTSIPKERKKDINYRKAFAGAAILNGSSVKQAIIAAGYSPWTARLPMQAGLSASSCVQELTKLDPQFSPANLTALAARALGERLSGMLEVGEHKKQPVLALAKVYQLTNLVAKPEPAGGVMEARKFLDTTAWLHGLLGELRDRGFEAKAQPVATIEAEKVDIPTMSDNAHNVNCESNPSNDSEIR